MEFLLIATAHFVALLSPGPDFFLITQTALRLPIRYCISLCAGIACANGCYLLFAIAGLESIRQFPLLLQMMHYLGGGYLIFIGWMLLKAPAPYHGQQQKNNFLHVERHTRQFSLGFMSAILNPKNAVFYLSLFTVMVSAETPWTIRSLYGLWMVAVVFFWDILIARTLGSQRFKNTLHQRLFLVEKFSGCVLAGFGLLLLLD